MLNAAGRKQVQDIIADAERQTSGEITVAWFKASDDYASGKERLGVIGIFLAALGIWLAGQYGAVEPGSSAMPAILVALAGGYIFGRFILGAFTGLRMRVISWGKLERAVRARAEQTFVERVVGHTAERNGVLVFVSTSERWVEVIADTGVTERVPAERLETIKTQLRTALTTRNPVLGLVYAVEETGKLLAEHFPRREGDVNELSDEVVTEETPPLDGNPT